MKNKILFGFVTTLIFFSMLNGINAEINTANCTEVSCFSDAGVEYEIYVLTALNNSEWVPIIVEVNGDKDMTNQIISNFSETEFKFKETLIRGDAFAGNITKNGLEKLINNPNVKSVYLSITAHILQNETNNEKLINKEKNNLNSMNLFIVILLIFLLIIFYIIFKKRR